MIKTFKKITIIKIKKNKLQSLNNNLQKFSKSLGLFNLRDKERSCYRVFVELLKSTKKDEGINSDELAYKLNLTRGTVIHHLNKLIDAGIVTNHKNKYFLINKSLSELVDRLKENVEDSLNKLKILAEDIDDKLN